MIYGYQELATRHPDYEKGAMTDFRTVEYTPDINYPLGIHKATFILRIEERDGRDYEVEIIECTSIEMFEHVPVKAHYFNDCVAWLNAEMYDSLGERAWNYGKEVTK